MGFSLVRSGVNISVPGFRSSDVVVRGKEAVLRLHPLLAEFSRLCGQDGRMEDLPYFLEKPGLFPAVPLLVLLTHRDRNDAAVSADELRAEDLAGAVLFYEYNVFGLRTRAFAIADRTGGALLAASALRLRIAARTCEVMMRWGANVALITADATEEVDQENDLRLTTGARKGYQWAYRKREQPTFLQLQSDLDSTLAAMGQKTRFNLRYYRRRAEKDLQCVFEPSIRITPQEFSEFNQNCAYSVSEQTALWRLKAHTQLQTPLLMGLKDSHGRWLSILGGRRWGNATEILWQLNRNDLPNHSLSTVMRSYHLEHEINEGAKRLFIEGGTNHSMQNSFVKKDVYDVVLIRTALHNAMDRVASRFISSDNVLAEVLRDRSLRWNSASLNT